MNDILLILKPWYPSIGAFLFFTVVRYIYKNFFIRLLRRLNNKVSFSYGEDFLNAFETPINIALFITAFYAAINLSPLASIHDVSFTDRILRTIIVTNFFWGLYNLIDTTHGVFFDLLERFGIQTDEAIANILATVFRMIIIMLGFVTVAREWNYDISAFIASLSIGSLAVAFAAKDALANVFGSMIILLDKPFKIGDWIKANGIEGIVESVSFRSTCIRTFPQELV
ncbi:mechanosensitive ion channel family protein, partial [Phascolarctobacterium succinatutens]|uniref:mechanosensitive ion channel family protein n=1 Tax=Phascolarctobacterium succinatutens TaxID=626940 RepID=UPI003FD884DE